MSDQKISDQDRDLFQQSIGKVAKVKSDKLHLRARQKPSANPRVHPVDYEEPLDQSMIDEAESLSLGDSLAFVAPGLQKNILKKLRKGFFGVDAEIDLHGLSQAEAKQQLLRFLHLSSQNGWRCVHIVHGKGYRSPNQHPVLKNRLNQWLRQHREVLAFCSAKPAEGGTGAVCVLLRLANKYDDQEQSEY